MIRALIFPWRLFELIQKELVTTFATERYFLPRVGRSITTLNIQGWALPILPILPMVYLLLR